MAPVFPKKKFQFYLSSIKRQQLIQVRQKLEMFQFYLSSIKRIYQIYS